MKIIKYSYITILFFLVILLAAFFRFYQLSSVPPSPSLDEVTIGYNAYSILHTGRDEYGYRFPLLLRAYDDYRPAGYVYLVVPFVKLFGLTVFAVRLPSAIMSVLDVILVYFLTKLIIPAKNKQFIGIIAAFLLTISPWHIYISRLGHEVNFGLFIVILSVFLFFVSIKKQGYSWVLILSSLFFGLSLYTYQSEKVFSPLFVCLLFLFFFKDLLKSKRTLLISIIVGAMVAYPAVKVTFSQQGLTRLRGTSAFTDIKEEYQITAERILVYKKQANFAGQIIENRRLVPLKIFFANYFSHIKPEWLYANGGKDQFKVPGFGLFYPWELLMFLAGIFFCMRIFDKRVIIFLLGWIGISFVAPAITTQSPHAMRAFTLLPAPQIIEASGFMGILEIFLNRYRSIGITIILAFLISAVISCSYFFNQYFYAFSKQQSESFQYALYDSIHYVLSHKSAYGKLIFSNSDNLTQSYMFYLFLSHYDPVKYLSNGGTKSGGFAQFHKYDSIDFRPIVWEKDRHISNILIVGNLNDFPAYARVVHSSYYLDGTKGVQVVKP